MSEDNEDQDNYRRQRDFQDNRRQNYRRNDRPNRYRDNQDQRPRRNDGYQRPEYQERNWSPDNNLIEKEIKGSKKGDLDVQIDIKDHDVMRMVNFKTQEIEETIDDFHQEENHKGKMILTKI